MGLLLHVYKPLGLLHGRRLEAPPVWEAGQLSVVVTVPVLRRKQA
jgi:hypothetical protein